MLKQLWIKLKETSGSVIPIVVLFVILYITPLVEFTIRELLVFLICSIFLIFGITLFNLGADMAMTPMGEQIGVSLIKTKKVPIIVIIAFIIGVLITIAEPDLSVLAALVKDVVSKELLFVAIGVGVGFFLMLAVLKIIFKIDLSKLLLFLYLLVFTMVSILLANERVGLLALSFDAGGVTTGPITVPFIMAMGVGVAATIAHKGGAENSFGLIALCSIGPVLAMLILGVATRGEIVYTVLNYEIPINLGGRIGEVLISNTLNVLLALGLIVSFFIIMNLIYLKLPKKTLIRISLGLVFTLVGLVIFLTAAEIGFVPIGNKLGESLATKNKGYIIVLGFIFGVLVVFAEPAVRILTKQVEEITTGAISKVSMLVALCIGVGLSIALAMLRVVFNFSILYLIIPGYVISLGLSFFVPKVYTAIAFDAGGVASGPLASSFILPFTIGACVKLQGEEMVLVDAFGVVAMIAMTPLITIQLLGFKSVITKKINDKAMLRKIISSDDAQIIEF